MINSVTLFDNVKQNVKLTKYFTRISVRRVEYCSDNTSVWVPLDPVRTVEQIADNKRSAKV